MPTARLLALIVALVAATTGGTASAVVQTPRPGPAKAPPATAKAPAWGDMAFYLVHGDANACGRGCSEWIAAEGKIDAGAAPRLIVRQRRERRDHVHSGRARRDHDAAAHRAKSCAYVNVKCRRVHGHARLRLGFTKIGRAHV